MAGFVSGGLVVPAGVEGELAEELAGCLGDDADVQVAGEDEDLGSGVGAAGADVVEFPGVAQGDGADGPDPVGADAVVGVGVAVAGGGLGPGGEPFLEGLLESPGPCPESGGGSAGRSSG
jgi:hypothetical protein